MWKRTVGIGVVAVVACCLGLRGENKAEDKKPDPKKTKELMHRKLAYSQKLLEALVMNDLAGAGKSSEQLLGLPKDPAWRVVNSKEYQIWSEEFTQNAQGIIKAVKDKNLESAKLQYLGLTMSCFHCHRYVRDRGDV